MLGALDAERAAENELNQEVWDAIGLHLAACKGASEGVEMKEIRTIQEPSEFPTD